MSWEIMERIDGRIAVWYDGAELRGLPYAVEGRRDGCWLEPVTGRYRTLRAAREAARERLKEADKTAGGRDAS